MISINMTKVVGPVGTQWLYQVLRKIWIEKRMPEDWYKGIILSIYMKGDMKLWELKTAKH